MEYYIIILLFLISCKMQNSNSTRANIVNNYQKETGFLKNESPNKEFILFYKIEEKKDNPVRWITFFVIKTSDQKIIRKKEGIAAEKIYWKDATTIAVILYKEVQQITTIPEQITSSEGISNNWNFNDELPAFTAMILAILKPP